MIKNIDLIFSTLKEAYSLQVAPSVTLISQTKKTAYHILFSTMISARTKDQVTLEASKKLFEKADNVESLSRLNEEEIAKLIYPAGFYKTKAARISETSKIIVNNYNSKIPDSIDELIKLPGIGRKTANLTIILGFNGYGICVDTHVHRICNRLGWVKTKSPNDTEMKLRSILDKKYWKNINNYMVSYGQTTCKPVSPMCSTCKINCVCPKIGVEKSR